MTVEKKWTDKEFIDTDNTYEITVWNNPGVELPYSGGIGTTVFYILGSLLFIGCGVVLIARRRISG